MNALDHAGTDTETEGAPESAPVERAMHAPDARGGLIDWVAYAGIFGLSFSAFVVDVLSGYGMLASSGYVLGVGLSGLVSMRYAPLGAATFATMLLVMGVAVHVIDEWSWVVAGERVVVLMGVWGMASWLMARRRIDPLRRLYRESEALVDTLCQASPYGVVMTTREGVVLSWNQQAAQLFGYTEGEVLGRDIADLIIPDRFAVAHRKGIEQYPFDVDQLPVVNERGALTAVDREGSEIPIELRVVPVQRAGGRMFVAYMRDASEHRAYEQQLEQFAHDMETRSEEMEEIISIVAHDLKRPIVSVSGLLNLVKEDAGGLLDEESVENLDLSMTECERMLSMVTELSALARAERAPWSFDRVELGELAEKCASQASALAAQRGATVEVDVAHVEVGVSERHIKECLTNLIENALYYGCPSPGGRVVVTGRVGERMAHIEVRDEGPGIPRDQHARMFQPFKRGVSTADTPGTGVGLFAVRRLIQQIGGTISLDSDTGAGARFTLRFPVRV